MSRIARFVNEPGREKSTAKPISRCAWLLAVGVVLTAIGCSKGPEQLPVFPVKGQLLAKGKPAEGALVVFHPAGEGPAKNLRPVGHVASDGSFTITTYAKDDGAPEGDYNVTVVWFKQIKKGKSGDPENGPSQVPAAYTNPTSTTLKAKIVSTGANELPKFELSGNAATVSTASRRLNVEE